MAATIKEIRAGLAANLAAVGRCSPYMLDNPMPPMFQIKPGEITYDLAMQRGLDELTFIVQGYQGSPFDQGSQDALDEWLAPTGATSVKAAIESDVTLGGKVQSVQVTTCSGYGRVDLATVGAVLAAEWTVTVFNTGH